MGYEQTKYGNSVTLDGNVSPTQKRRLLDVSLPAIDSKELYKSGGWVLTLEAHNDLSPAIPDVNTPIGSVGVLLVTATITIGSGGAAIPFQVTVMAGTTLLLPAGLVSVDVELVGVPSGVVMRVSGIIQRGEAVNTAVFLQQFAMTSAATPQSGPIPNFATGLRVDAGRDSPWYSNQTLWSLGSLVFLGPTMKDLFAKSLWLPIGPTARIWSLLGKPAATEIAYGTFFANLVWRIEP